ncbi:MAG: type I-F CRISPR-associated protein Csy1, partial [Hydrogenophaga sp.]|nr:type I-F CRISPR-associated protein Csy1 [Hydrogenophaga sp.]
MQNHHPQRSAELRAVIVEFLNKRLADKLDGIKGDNPEDEPLRQQRRTELHQQFQPATWLEDAARRASQIQAVTHSLKPIHPDAKGTSLYCLPAELASLPVVGSHCLGAEFADDFVCDAKLLPIVAFLKLEHGSQTMLALCIQKDVDLSVALNSDPNQASAWMDSFAAVASTRGNPSSHTLAKQLYWPVFDNPHSDEGFHVLSPLYASSLAHKVYGQLQDDRFSDEAKAAREAKRAETFSERPVREYRHMAVQQMGGSNTQNISQLNSKRRGNNHLLASLPPVWQSVAVKPLLNTDSLFHRYSRRPLVRQHVKALLDFLKTDPHPNQATRNQRAGYVD